MSKCLKLRGMSSEKSPAWLRIILIALGAIGIGLSFAVIANPDTTTVFFAMLLGIALILIGIARVIEGAAGPKTKGSRGIDIAIGAIAIIAGILAISNPFGAVLAMITIINVFLLIYGLGMIATGAAAKNLGKGYRIATMIIGGIVTAFALTLWAIPGLTLVLMITFFSIGLLISGIGNIVSGILGRRVGPI